jgi:Ca2+-binding RTX toxin-like protein
MTTRGDYYLELNDDGTPRRKHGIDEEKTTHPILGSAIGMALFNVIILIKNILFSESAPAYRSGPTSVENSPHSSVDPDSTPISDGEAGTSEGSGSPPDSAAAEMSGAARNLRGGTDTFVPVQPPDDLAARLGVALAQVGNDNETLYGSSPGTGVTLHLDDAIPSGSRGFGGTSSGPDGESQSRSPDGDNQPSQRDDDNQSGRRDDDNELDDNELDDDVFDDGDGQDSGSDPDRTINRLPLLASAVILESLLVNQARAIALADFLKHASDPEGSALTVSKVVASSGHVIQRTDTSWLYIPELNDTSGVTFSYLVSDGVGAVQQTAFMDLQPGSFTPVVATALADRLIGSEDADMIDAGAGNDTVISNGGDDVIYGGDGDDRIVAGDGHDVIYGGGGNDVIFAGSGNDVVHGDDGDDIIFGEDGDDTLFGDDGADTISGGAGSDTIIAGSGDDIVHGDDGNDILFGDDGTDTIFGGAGSDTIIAGSGDDVIHGDDGADTIFGGAGRDTIDAGSGDDVVIAGAEADTVSGGAGDDLFIATAGDGNDTFDGGEGSDTYDATQITTDVTIDLNAGTASGFDIGEDFLFDVDNTVGGSGDDILIASNAVNTLAGGSGEDVFVFTSSLSAGKGSGNRDKILDFEVGDRIDIDDISDEFEDEFKATFDDTNIRKFVLIGQELEFTKPGQVRFKYDVQNEAAVTILEGNIDQDADTEFEIEIVGLHTLRDEDFQWRA